MSNTLGILWIFVYVDSISAPLLAVYTIKFIADSEIGMFAWTFGRMPGINFSTTSNDSDLLDFDSNFSSRHVFFFLDFGGECDQ